MAIPTATRRTSPSRRELASARPARVYNVAAMVNAAISCGLEKTADDIRRAFEHNEYVNYLEQCSQAVIY